MKGYTKNNIVIFGLLTVALLFYILKNHTIKEGSLGSDAEALKRFLEKAKDIAGEYVSVPG